MEEPSGCVSTHSRLGPETPRDDRGGIEGLPVPPELESLVLHMLPDAYAVVSMFVCRRWAGALRDRRIGHKGSLCALLAEQGDLAVLRWARERADFSWDNRTTLAACRRNAVEILRYQHANGGLYFGIGGSFLRDAAVAGSLEALKYLRSLGASNDMVCYDAAAGGHLDALKWARAEGFQCWWNVADAAARHGRFEVLEWLLEQPDADWWPRTVTYEAAKRGDLPMLDLVSRSVAARPPPETDRYGLRRGPQANDFAIGATVGAAIAGDLDLLRELHLDRGWRVDESVCKSAAWAGALHVLEWLVSEVGCPWNARECMLGAGSQGHVHVLQWATAARGVALFPDLCTSAVGYQRVDTLRWLISAGCPCDLTACARRASEFHCPPGSRGAAVRDYVDHLVEERAGQTS